jgi:hypothetical protein
MISLFPPLHRPYKKEFSLTCLSGCVVCALRNLFAQNPTHSSTTLSGLSNRNVSSMIANMNQKETQIYVLRVGPLQRFLRPLDEVLQLSLHAPYAT